MRFLDKVRKTISTYNMCLEENEPVVVALSGGADSTSLLLAMHELGFEVHAIHVNHNLRGAEAKRDEDFCYSLCNELGIDIEIFSVDVNSYSIENKMSTETAARDLRYKAFKENANGIKKVIVAHNLNDCLETTIYNLTRGTSLNGLCGVAPVMYREDLDITVFRPLIECTRDEIEDYLHEKNIGFVTDSTNNSNDYTRNIIRNRVIPILAEINPSVVKTYGDTVKALRKDSEYINERATRLEYMLFNNKELDLSWLELTDMSLLSRVLTNWLSKYYNIKATRNVLNNIIQAVRTKSDVQLGTNVYCRVKDETLYIEQQEQYVDNEDYDSFSEVYDIEDIIKFTQTSSEEDKHNVIQFKHSTISFKIIESPKDAINIHNVFAINVGSNTPVKVRHRHPADRIKLYKRPTKAVKELFNSAKMDKFLRDKIVMIESNNELIFVDRFGVCDKLRCRQPIDGEKLVYIEVLINYNIEH